MTYGYDEIEFIGKLLQFYLPHLYSLSIGSAAVCRDQQFPCIRVSLPAHEFLPSPYEFHCELRSIMIDAHIDPSLVPLHVIHTIWYRFSICISREIVHVDMIIFTLRFSFLSVVLEIADQFLLLCVHGYDGLVLLHEFHCSIAYVPELFITIRFTPSFV